MSFVAVLDGAYSKFTVACLGFEFPLYQKKNGSVVCLLSLSPHQKAIHDEYMSREAPIPEDLFYEKPVLTSKSFKIFYSHVYPFYQIT
jgi:hypothetical protein